MDFSKISNAELCERMDKLVRTERKITHLVLIHINEIESRRLYAELGFDGMFSYLTKGLGYSESAAYRRLQSARVFKQVPSIADKIENGSLNLSQLTQIQKCIKEEVNKTGHAPKAEFTESLISKIEGKTTFETEKVLAVEFDRPVQMHERLKPQQDDSVRIELTLSKEQFELLEEIKSLASHSCPNGTLAEIITYLAPRYKKSKLGKESNTTPSFSEAEVKALTKPLAKKEKLSFAKTPAETIETTKKIEGATTKISKRSYISIKTKRMLMKKARYECEYVDHTSGIKCASIFQLQIDHKHPLALGGSNDPQNLRILCRTHNQSEANRFGLFKSDNLSKHFR